MSGEQDTTIKIEADAIEVVEQAHVASSAVGQMQQDIEQANMQIADAGGKSATVFGTAWVQATKAIRMNVVQMMLPITGAVGAVTLLAGLADKLVNINTKQLREDAERSEKQVDTTKRILALGERDYKDAAEAKKAISKAAADEITAITVEQAKKETTVFQDLGVQAARGISKALAFSPLTNQSNNARAEIARLFGDKTSREQAIIHEEEGYAKVRADSQTAERSALRRIEAREAEEAAKKKLDEEEKQAATLKQKTEEELQEAEKLRESYRDRLQRAENEALSEEERARAEHAQALSKLENDAAKNTAITALDVRAAELVLLKELENKLKDLEERKAKMHEDEMRRIETENKRRLEGVVRVHQEFERLSATLRGMNSLFVPGASGDASVQAIANILLRGLGGGPR